MMTTDRMDHILCKKTNFKESKHVFDKNKITETEETERCLTPVNS